RYIYIGHKKYLALKYSARKCTDSLIYYLYVPYEGYRNDNHLLGEGYMERLC
ncbi:hypothetical protein DFP73DRAFT_458313, partial [Morchella snyderi]